MIGLLLAATGRQRTSKNREARYADFHRPPSQRTRRKNPRRVRRRFPPALPCPTRKNLRRVRRGFPPALPYPTRRKTRSPREPGFCGACGNPSGTPDGFCGAYGEQNPFRTRYSNGQEKETLVARDEDFCGARTPVLARGRRPLRQSRASARARPAGAPGSHGRGEKPGERAPRISPAGEENPSRRRGGTNNPVGVPTGFCGTRTARRGKPSPRAERVSAVPEHLC